MQQLQQQAAAFATAAALRSSRQRWCAQQLPLPSVPRRSTLLAAAARPAAQHIAIQLLASS